MGKAQDRKQFILRQLQRGASQADIARQLGMSRQRVHSMLVELDLKEAYRDSVQQRRQQTAIEAEANNMRHLLRPCRPPTSRRWFPDEVLLAGLRAAAAVQPDHVCSIKAYERWRKDRADGIVPTQQSVAARFGSWAAACAAAGVVSGKLPSGAGRAQSWSDLQLQQYLERYANEMIDQGVRPTCPGYDSWSKQHPEAPSYATMRRRRFPMTSILNQVKTSRLAQLD